MKKFYFYKIFFVLGLAKTYSAASGSDFTESQELPHTFPEGPALQPEPAQVSLPEDLHSVSEWKLPNHDIL